MYNIDGNEIRYKSHEQIKNITSYNIPNNVVKLADYVLLNVFV